MFTYEYKVTNFYTNLPNLVISAVPPELCGWWMTLDDTNDLFNAPRPSPLPWGPLQLHDHQSKEKKNFDLRLDSNSRLDRLGDWIGLLTCVRLD